LGAGGVEDHVVETFQFLMGDVLAKGDVAEVAKTGFGGSPVVGFCHRLDVGMVGATP
jgi:hypothetical protein